MALRDFTGSSDALGPDTQFLHPDATALTTPVSDTSSKKVVVRRLEIAWVPWAMRSMGWTVSAALMERWFRSQAWAMPESWKDKSPPPLSIREENCDESIVTMDWAMRFPVCVKAYDELLARVSTAPTVSTLKKRLEAIKWDEYSIVRLGKFGMSARAMDAQCQVNFKTFGGKVSSLDDMYGALGAATLKLGMVGDALRDVATGRRVFRVSALGFYIRDHYDFNGPQFLGIWTENRVLTKTQHLALAAGGGAFVLDDRPFAAVTNEDFRNYRARHGRGGDFVLYSDVLWKKVDLTIDLDSAP